MYQQPFSGVHNYFSWWIALAGEFYHGQQSELYTEPQSEQQEEQLAAWVMETKMGCKDGLSKPKLPRWTGSTYNTISLGEHGGNQTVV